MRPRRVKGFEVDPFSFVDKDPDLFEVRDVPHAGRGLFVKREFHKGEFLLNYRGTVKIVASDNPYAFETGPPENLVVDSSEDQTCLARFINDVDPYHTRNCEARKIYSNDGKWTIAFFTTTSISEGTELRYSYGTKVAPWRQTSFWTKKAGLAVQVPKQRKTTKRKVSEAPQKEVGKSVTNDETEGSRCLEVVAPNRELGEGVKVVGGRLQGDSTSKLAALEVSRDSTGPEMSELEGAFQSFVNSDNTQLALQLNSFLEGNNTQGELEELSNVSDCLQTDTGRLEVEDCCLEVGERLKTTTVEKERVKPCLEVGERLKTTVEKERVKPCLEVGERLKTTAVEKERVKPCLEVGERLKTTVEKERVKPCLEVGERLKTATVEKERVKPCLEVGERLKTTVEKERVKPCLEVGERLKTTTVEKERVKPCLEVGERLKTTTVEKERVKPCLEVGERLKTTVEKERVKPCLEVGERLKTATVEKERVKPCLEVGDRLETTTVGGLIETATCDLEVESRCLEVGERLETATVANLLVNPCLKVGDRLETTTVGGLIETATCDLEVESRCLEVGERLETSTVANLLVNPCLNVGDRLETTTVGGLIETATCDLEVESRCLEVGERLETATVENELVNPVGSIQSLEVGAQEEVVSQELATETHKGLDPNASIEWNMQGTSHPHPQNDEKDERSDTDSSDSDSDTESETEEPKLRPLKSYRSKRPSVEKCLLCAKEVHKMRDHLTNLHKLPQTDPIRKFLLSYYSTIKTDRCFQCNVCNVRMGDKHRHPKEHNVERIGDREDMSLFPHSIVLAIKNFQSGLHLPNSQFVEAWITHQKGLFSDGDVSGQWDIPSTQKAFLCKAIQATAGFTDTLAFAVFVREYFEEKHLTRITVVNYICSLEKLIKYAKAYKPSQFPGLAEVDWLVISRDVKARYQKGSLKEKRRTRQKLFEKVPDMNHLATVYSKMTELCNEDVSKKFLSLDELKCFNFIILCSNLNGRPGPINDLTWSLVKKIKKEGQFDCDNHKTGHYYDIKLKIHKDQFPWLKRLKEEFKKKHGYVGDRVFGTQKDKKDHSLANIIRKVMAQHFDNEILEKNFNGNSIRKTWETYMFYNKHKLSQEELAFHETQSAHRKQTAEAHYVKHSSEVSDFYHDTIKRAVQKLNSSTPSGSKLSSYSDSSDINLHSGTSVQKRQKTVKWVAPDVQKQSTSSTPSHDAEVTTPVQKRRSYIVTPEISSTPIPAVEKKSKEKTKKPKVSAPKEVVSSDENSLSFSEEDSDEEMPVPAKKARKKNPTSKGQVNREAFIKTLTIWRKRMPSKEEAKAMELFSGLHYRIHKEDALRKIEEAGIKLSEASKSIVYAKLKWACNQHLPSANK